MRILLLPLPLLTLAACSGEAPMPAALNVQARGEAKAAREQVADQRAVAAGFAPAAPAPLKVANIDAPEAPAPGAILPAASEQYRYIGRWAPDAAACAAASWTFRTRDLKVADGPSCRLPTVSDEPAGYELQGTCTTERRDAARTLTLTFDERARTMTVAGLTSRPATLLYCGA